MQPVLFVFMLAAGVFLLAGATRNHGWYIADQLCVQGAALCDNPGAILIMVGVVLLAVMVRAVVKT